jgi:predicted Zn-dependent protease with MMP-like domain
MSEKISSPPISDEERQLFDSVLEEILDSFPEEYLDMLEEVPVIVDDEPSVELQKEMGAYLEGEPADLMGLHSGPSLSDTKKHDPLASTPLIQLFRGPILREANGNRKKLMKEIRITLIHELGHHFDFSEEDLEDRGFG